MSTSRRWAPSSPLDRVHPHKPLIFRGQAVASGNVMHHRYASINDLPIADSERKFHWPLGRRPDEHPGLSDLGL